jgi:hypothetical protein
MGAGVFFRRFAGDDSGCVGIHQGIVGIVVNAKMFPQAGKGVGFQFRIMAEKSYTDKKAVINLYKKFLPVYVRRRF